MSFWNYTCLKRWCDCDKYLVVSLVWICFNFSCQFKSITRFPIKLTLIFETVKSDLLSLKKTILTIRNLAWSNWKGNIQPNVYRLQSYKSSQIDHTQSSKLLYCFYLLQIQSNIFSNNITHEKCI